MHMWKSVLIFSLFFSALLAQTNELPPCTQADLKGYYSQCLTLDATRTLYFYYSFDCNSFGLQVPPPIYNLPCDIDCDPGTYLPLNSSQCEPCSAGTFSLGGGVRIYDWTAPDWPHSTNYAFSTYCSPPETFDNVGTPDPNCHGWVLETHETNSGNLKGKSSLNSVLSLTYSSLEGGSVGFAYMSSSERDGDIFMYQIDSNSPVILSNSGDYTYKSISMPAGGHKIKWIYYKNPDPGLGGDIARLWFVEIYGLTPSDDISCTPCAPGLFADADEADHCWKCPPNTYSADYGASECTPCPEGTFSHQGASLCDPYSTNCTSANQVVLYTECVKTGNSWTQTQYTLWQTPLTCNPAGVELPANTTVSCSPCAAGSYLDTATEQCVYCDPGYYTSSRSTCSICDAGSVAVAEVHYTQWNSLPQGWTTHCYGDCADNGWQPSGSSIRATLPQGYLTDSLLNFNVTVTAAGYIEYTYAIQGRVHHSYFEVTVDGAGVYLYDSGSGSDMIPLAEGTHTISFWAHGDAASTTTISVSAVSVYGTVGVGGASKCTLCPAGQYQDRNGQVACKKCMYGFYSEEGATSCSACPEDTYASHQGSGECFACPDGTHSGKGAAYCDNPSCNFYTSDGNSYYNLSPYTGLTQYVANQEDYNGFYTVSYCGPLIFEDESAQTCPFDSTMCETFFDFNPYNPSQSSLNWANSVLFEQLEDPYAGFILHYSGGDITGCSDNRTASVNFVCELDPSRYTQLTLDTDASTKCNKVFSQVTVYGCPVCHLEDFDRQEGDCEDGQMLVHYEKKAGIKCNGVIKDFYTDCPEFEIPFGLVIVVTVAAAAMILGLVAIILIVYWKHRRLVNKYTKLCESNASNVEMQEVDDDGDAESAE